MKACFLRLIILMLAAVFFSPDILSQPNLGPAEFPLPGMYFTRGYAYAGTNITGSPGGGQFYDFTGINPVYHDTIKYYDAQLTPWYAHHTGSESANAEVLGNIIYVYYNDSDASSFIRTGLTMIGDFSQGQDTVHGSYIKADTLISDQMEFGHSSDDFSVAIINNIIPFANYKILTRRKLLADGWGLLSTPLNTYDSVLRIRYAEYRYDTASYFGTPIYTTADTVYYFRYFARNVRYPVVTAYTDSLYNLLYFEYIFSPPVICGCTDSMAINFNPTATQSDSSCIYCNVGFTISNDTTVCPGSPVALSVTGGSAFLWNNGSTASVINVAPAYTTTYSVYVSSSPVCHALGSVTVYVDEPVTAGFWTEHDTYIMGQDVQFINLSQSANAWWWEFDDTVNGSSVLKDPVHSYSVTGQKQVLLIAGNSCFSDTAINILNIVSPSGVDHSLATPEIHLYPNPGREELGVEVLCAGFVQQVTATDISGRKISLHFTPFMPLSGMLKINTHGLSPGMYVIEVLTADTRYLQKWVKLP